MLRVQGGLRTCRTRGVFKSATPVGYSVGKAIAKILSFPAASSIGVDRTSGAGRPGGVRLSPEIS
jgi:hypothetical protein